MRHALLAPLALLASGTALQAQVSDSLLSATISQSFVADSNFDLDDPSPGTSYYGDTRLVLGLLNETQTQTFALGLDTGLRALWQAEEDFDFTFASPSTASLDYGNEWASGTFDTFLRFRQTDVDSTVLVDLDQDVTTPDDIREINNNATELRYDAGVALEFATDSPSSYVLNLDATRFDYTDDTDDDNTPRTTVAGDAAWLLQLTPVLSSVFGGAYSYFTADNADDTQIRQGEVEAGVVYDPSDVLQLTFGAGYATYEREERANPGTPREKVQDDSGYVVRGGMRYVLEDVTLIANLRLTDAAPETRLSGDIRATYPLPSGRVTGRVFQRYGGGNDGDEIRVTGAAIGLDHEINTVSRLGFDISVARQENLDTDESDTDRLNFTAAYTYDVTEVVSANIGYRFRSRQQDPEDATSNAVFFEIARTFETRP